MLTFRSRSSTTSPYLIPPPLVVCWAYLGVQILFCLYLRTLVPLVQELPPYWTLLQDLLLDGETWSQNVAGTVMAINLLFVVYLWAGLHFHRIVRCRHQRMRLFSYFGTAGLFALSSHLLLKLSLVAPDVTLLRWPMQVQRFFP